MLSETMPADLFEDDYQPVAGTDHCGDNCPCHEDDNLFDDEDMEVVDEQEFGDADDEDDDGDDFDPDIEVDLVIFSGGANTAPGMATYVDSKLNEYSLGDISDPDSFAEGMVEMAALLGKNCLVRSYTHLGLSEGDEPCHCIADYDEDELTLVEHQESVFDI